MRNEIASESLVWLSSVACVLAAVLVQPIRASIECHQHVDKRGYLKTEDGEYLMETCESSSSTCFESFVKKKEGKLAIYKAGCSSCTPNKDEECRTCKTPMCNDAFAKKIKANNRQCISGSSVDRASFGSKTVHCADWVNDCYYHTAGKDWEMKYFAGCGTSLFPKPDSTNEHCSTDLCNYPKSLKDSVAKHLDKLPPKTTDVGDRDGKPTDSVAQASAEPDDKKADSKTDGKNEATTKMKKPEESEDFYDSSSDTQAVTCTAAIALSIAVICIRYDVNWSSAL